jgi:transcriptional regulator with AAA-type ATPase domain
LKRQENRPKLYEEIGRAVQSGLNVVLEGESGVGKDYLARLIYEKRNWGGKLVTYDCEQSAQDQTRIVEQLTSSVFFQQQILTHKDTLFVRRIDLLQAHLLAQLSDFFEELGKRGCFPRKRLLSLGMRGSLEKRELSKYPNQALLYKFLNSLFCYKIEIPPLREREEEIPYFVKKFLASLNFELRRNVTEISQDALQLLLQYHWPNNLCELRSEIERAIILTKDYEPIRTSVFSERLAKSVSKTSSLTKSA